MLLRAKLPVGHVDPGDSVWWHPDVIHGVEALHQGKVFKVWVFEMRHLFVSGVDTFT